MKTLDYLHLDASAVSNVVASLKQLLADYQVFYTNLRGFHWNIKGHGFFVLHGKFEDMYNNAAEKVDELAERILMLGGEPENKFSEYLKVARVKEVSGVSCGDEALKNILDIFGNFRPFCGHPCVRTDIGCNIVHIKSVNGRSPVWNFEFIINLK